MKKNWKTNGIHKKRWVKWRQGFKQKSSQECVFSSTNYLSLFRNRFFVVVVTFLINYQKNANLPCSVSLLFFFFFLNKGQFYSLKSQHVQNNILQKQKSPIEYRRKHLVLQSFQLTHPFWLVYFIYCPSLCQHEKEKAKEY